MQTLIAIKALVCASAAREAWGEHWESLQDLGRRGPNLEEGCKTVSPLRWKKAPADPSSERAGFVAGVGFEPGPSPDHASDHAPAARAS